MIKDGVFPAQPFICRKFEQLVHARSALENLLIRVLTMRSHKFPS